MNYLQVGSFTQAEQQMFGVVFFVLATAIWLSGSHKNSEFMNLLYGVFTIAGVVFLIIGFLPSGAAGFVLIVAFVLAVLTGWISSLFR